MTEINQKWLDKGQWLEVKGHRVFYIDTGGDKPVLCILHGFPTSTLDYQKAIPFLKKHFRVVLHDHLGFGASDKPVDYSYSLIEQTDIAILLWRQLALDNITVFAHDYGTSIATELMARQAIESSTLSINSYILSNGSVHIEYARLRLIQKLLRHSLLGPLVARFTRLATFESNLRKITYKKDCFTEDEIVAHWSMLIRDNGREVLSKISQYTLERKKYWHRWIGALKDSKVPVDLIWARNDPIARSIIADTIHKECAISQLKWIEECGHFPMIEQVEEWSESLIQQISIRRSLTKP